MKSLESNQSHRSAALRKQFQLSHDHCAYVRIDIDIRFHQYGIHKALHLDDTETLRFSETLRCSLNFEGELCSVIGKTYCRTAIVVILVFIFFSGKRLLLLNQSLNEIFLIRILPQ